MPNFVGNITRIDTTRYSDAFASHSTYASLETNKYDGSSTVSYTKNNGSTVSIFVACGVAALLIVSIVIGILVWKQKGIKKHCRRNKTILNHKIFSNGNFKFQFL